ncbi:MAG: GNAT family N-acetyltransferase [Ktedonobacterales bacterium]
MEGVASGVRIRRAHPEEAELLTELIMRSKAFWGYDATLLAAWRSDLTLESKVVARDPVYCAEDRYTGFIMGVSHFYRLDDDELYLDHLFVEPACMGKGVGARLWSHAVAQAAAQGLRAVVLGADPNARPFYERMGAVVVGWEESPIVPGRRTPVMRYDLPPC